MRKVLRNSVIAAGTTTALLAGMTPAHASIVESFCGSQVADYGTVTMTSCFWEDTGTYEFIPIAKWRSTANGTWTACTVTIGLYDNSVKVRQTQHNCVSQANAKTPVTFFGAWFTPQSTHCYTTQAMWTGTFGGNSVGSANNSQTSGGPCG